MAIVDEATQQRRDALVEHMTQMEEIERVAKADREDARYIVLRSASFWFSLGLYTLVVIAITLIAEHYVI